MGLLGLLPIAIGINYLLSKEPEEETLQDESIEYHSHSTVKPEKKSFLATLKDSQTYRVSAVTIANGGNNIGIYAPLFANSNLPSLAVILCVCYCTIGFWCCLSYYLVCNPLMAPVLTRYGRKLFPFVLIYLGYSILIKSESYNLLPNIAMFSR